jgi:hypothetical protein
MEAYEKDPRSEDREASISKGIPLNGSASRFRSSALLPKKSGQRCKHAGICVTSAMGRKGGLSKARAASSAYIFPGLFLCGMCGANITLVAVAIIGPPTTTFRCTATAEHTQILCGSAGTLSRGKCRRRSRVKCCGTRSCTTPSADPRQNSRGRARSEKRLDFELGIEC